MLTIYISSAIIKIVSILSEVAYSFYKKDRVYTLPGFLCNSLTALSIRLMVYLNIVTLPALLYYFALKNKFFSNEEFSLTHTVFSVFISVLLMDFAFYILHRAHHTFSFLWVFHQVHHSGKDLNLTTQFRASWVERFYFGASLLIAPLLLGFHPKIVAISSAIVFLYQFFTHSQYLKLPVVVQKILITPYTHSIHHDQEERHQMSNFGSVFSIWDRIFGTYINEIKILTPGIKNYKQNNFLKVQTDPIISYCMNNFKKIEILWKKK